MSGRGEPQGVIDPGRYDAAELQSLAGVDGDAASDGVEADAAAESREDDSPNPDEVVRSRQTRALLSAARAAGGGRPYLPVLPGGPRAEALALEWLEYLRARGGRRRAAEALSYYARIGWLGDDAVAGLERRLDGVDPTPGETSALRAADHRLSLVYVARLAALAGRPGETRGSE